MILDKNNYFNKKLGWDKNYKIKVVKTQNEVDEMLSYFMDFNDSKSKNKYVGLDFEFNSSPEGKKIALFQINLEQDNSDGFIYLFYPPDLKEEKEMKILINLLTNPSIKKILHGAESLDIPYLFKNIFTDNNLREEFCKNLYDTRYLCEYYHLENKIEGKCKIYSLLYEMNVIDDNILDMLAENEEKMGPIYLVDIDVRNLNESTMLYSAFDVLYLPALLNQFPDKYEYIKLIPEITCFNYKDRYDNFFTKPFSELVNKYNNYFIEFDETKIKLIDIYLLYYYWIDDSSKVLGKLKEINYFKKFIEVFIKYIVYKNLLILYDVWESNTEKIDFDKEFKEKEEEFGKIGLSSNLNLFFSEIRNKIKKDISSY